MTPLLPLAVIILKFVAMSNSGERESRPFHEEVSPPLDMFLCTVTPSVTLRRCIPWFALHSLDSNVQNFQPKSMVSIQQMQESMQQTQSATMISGAKPFRFWQS